MKMLFAALAALIVVPMFAMVTYIFTATVAVSSIDPLDAVDATAHYRQDCLPPLGPQQRPRAKRAYIDRYDHSTPHYFAAVCINMTALNMHVARDQSAIMLTWNQAVEMRLSPNRLSFDEPLQINGRSQKGAKITLNRIRIGDIEFTNVDALIARDDELSYGIVGQAFLSRLKHYGVDKKRKLVLVAH